MYLLIILNFKNNVYTKGSEEKEENSHEKN